MIHLNTFLLLLKNYLLKYDSVYNAHKYLNSKKMNVRPPYIETIIKSGEE